MQIIEAFARGLPHLKLALELGCADIQAFQVMFMLLSVSLIQHNSGQFLAANIVDCRDYALLSTVEGMLCAVLRIDAVNLVEAWKFSDVRLDSTLGRL